MKLQYKTKKLEKECDDYRKAQSKYGDRCAKLLHQRVKQLKASFSLDEMVEFRIGRCHKLTGNLKGKYALDLEHPYRLIVEPINDDCGEVTGVKIVKLLEVKDYHGN